MNVPQRFTVLSLLAVLALGGCASSSSDGTSRDPNLITRAELEAVGNISALRAIERLRANWLRTRMGDGDPVLFVDGIRQQDTGYLDTMRAADIEQIRFRSASDATTRYGTGFNAGAIEVTTRRR